MASRPFLVGVVAMAAFGVGAAQAEVRIMMRSNPASPASTASPVATAPPAAAAPAPAAPPSAAPPALAGAPANEPLSLRRGDADATISETASDAAPPAPPPPRIAKPPAPRVSAEPRPAPPAEDSPSERRAAGLLAAGAPAPAPVSSVRRRNQSPDEFRDRCTTDGGLMQGGGKYGLCIIR